MNGGDAMSGDKQFLIEESLRSTCSYKIKKLIDQLNTVENQLPEFNETGLRTINANLDTLLDESIYIAFGTEDRDEKKKA